MFEYKVIAIEETELIPPVAAIVTGEIWTIYLYFASSEPTPVNSVRAMDTVVSFYHVWGREREQDLKGYLMGYLTYYLENNVSQDMHMKILSANLQDRTIFYPENLVQKAESKGYTHYIGKFKSFLHATEYCTLNIQDNPDKIVPPKFLAYIEKLQKESASVEELAYP